MGTQKKEQVTSSWPAWSVPPTGVVPKHAYPLSGFDIENDLQNGAPQRIHFHWEKWWLKNVEFLDFQRNPLAALNHF